MMYTEMVELMKSIVAPGFEFKVHFEGAPIPIYLQVSFKAVDVQTEEVRSWTGRKWQLSSHMTKSEIVQTAFKAALTVIEHELRASFTYKGRPILGPHFDVDKLWELSGPDALDVRHG